MHRARKTTPEDPTGEIVDFDEAMLDALTPEARANALAEAGLLARAFAPGAAADELESMARALSSGARDRDMDRKHARRLA
ncbi:hypothetical protein, partial [Phenylobacterium sp.]|uniref:hypothetical protein n=1 Tax=Phenylobacterium sp. TaxID=1871053 RepID=UPI002DF49810|nr:hypothetical protein [Phenylobacterium sp.]